MKVPHQKKSSAPTNDGLCTLLARTPAHHISRWWILPLLLAILGLRLYLSYSSSDSEKPLRVATNFSITRDPSQERRQQIIDNFISSEKAATQQSPKPIAPGMFRVAAAQIFSIMGNSDANRKKMEALVRAAAAAGASLIVFPEAALPGYADPDYQRFWTLNPAKSAAANEGEFLPVTQVGENEDSAEITYFRNLAKELQLYIALPYIERYDGKFYSNLSLIDTTGNIVLRCRKHKLWLYGDLQWATAGAEAPEIVSTPFGKIGLAISYDMNSLFPALSKAGASLILHSAAFYGDNMERWAASRYRALAAKAGCAIVLANWGSTESPGWSGYGLSRVYAADGTLVAGQGALPGEILVIADLPLPGAASITPAPTESKK